MTAKENPMITFDQANTLVASRIKQLEHDAKCEMLVLEALTQELEEGWVFFYDSRTHQETHDVRDALAGNGPIFVDRSGKLQIIPTHVTWRDGIRLPASWSCRKNNESAVTTSWLPHAGAP